MISPHTPETNPLPPDSEVLVIPLDFKAGFSELTAGLEPPTGEAGTALEKTTAVWCVAASCLIAPLFLASSEVRARYRLKAEARY